MTAASPPRVPGYDLAPPSDADARAMLARVFGAERAPAVWAAACRDARIDPARVDTIAALERVSLALAAQGGAASTIARSIAIRLRTYARLAARGDITAGATT